MKAASEKKPGEKRARESSTKEIRSLALVLILDALLATIAFYTTYTWRLLPSPPPLIPACLFWLVFFIMGFFIIGGFCRMLGIRGIWSVQEIDEKPALPRRPSVSRWRSEAAYIGGFLIIPSFIVLGPAFRSDSALLFFLPPCLYWTGVILLAIKHPGVAALLFILGIIISVIIYYITLGVYLVTQYMVNGP